MDDYHNRNSSNYKLLSFSTKKFQGYSVLMDFVLHVGNSTPKTQSVTASSEVIKY